MKQFDFFLQSNAFAIIAALLIVFTVLFLAFLRGYAKLESRVEQLEADAERLSIILETEDDDPLKNWDKKHLA